MMPACLSSKCTLKIRVESKKRKEIKVKKMNKKKIESELFFQYLPDYRILGHFPCLLTFLALIPVLFSIFYFLKERASFPGLAIFHCESEG